MRQYFFNFRKGDELWVDRVGMYLPDLDAARAEALHALRELLDIAGTDEVPDCCEMLVRDSESDIVLTIPPGKWPPG